MSSNKIAYFFQLLSTTIGLNQLSTFEQDFVDNLIRFTTELHYSGNYDKACWLYQKSIELTQKRSKLIVYNYARFLCTCHLHNQEITTNRYLFQAYDLLFDCVVKNPTYCAAVECLDTIKNLIVDRWHFRMLNDNVRNQYYKQAIEKAIHTRPEGCTVLDIGGGTGILSIYAALAGAKKVYYCELSKELCDIARICIKKSGVPEGVIHIINKHSFDITIHPSASSPSLDHPAPMRENDCNLRYDLHERVDLIVTELVDSGLLGEKIIPTLQNAKKRLLRHDNGVIIPHKARVFMTPIQSDNIALRTTFYPCSLQSSEKNDIIIDNIDNRDVEALNDFNSYNNVYGKYFYLEKYFMSSKSLYNRFQLDESYTCEHLHRNYPFISLCNLNPLFDIYFNNIPIDFPDSSISYVTMDNVCNASDIILKQFISEMTPICNGRIDGYAYWFDLYLENYGTYDKNETSQQFIDVFDSQGTASINVNEFIKSDNDIHNIFFFDKTKTTTKSATNTISNSDKLIISTDPCRVRNSWDQAIIFEKSRKVHDTQQMFNLAHQSGHNIYQGVKIYLNVAITLDKIYIYHNNSTQTVNNHNNIPSQSQFHSVYTKIEKSKSNSQKITTQQSESKINTSKLSVGEADMAFLNNHNYRSAYLTAVYDCVHKYHYDCHDDSIIEHEPNINIIEFTSHWQSIAVYMKIINNFSNSKDHYSHNDKMNTISADSNNTRRTKIKSFLLTPSQESAEFIKQIIADLDDEDENGDCHSCTHEHEAINPHYSNNHSNSNSNHYHYDLMVSDSNILDIYNSIFNYFESNNDQNNRNLNMLNNKISPQKHYIIICTDLVDTSGLIRVSILKELCFLLQLLRPAHDNDKTHSQNKNLTDDETNVPLLSTSISNKILLSIVPNSFSIMIQGFESFSLIDHHKVNPVYTYTANIADEINKLGVNYLRELDLDNIYDIKFMSDPQEATILNLQTLQNVDPLVDIVCKNVVTLIITKPGVLHAVGIWFKLHTISTNNPNIIETRDTKKTSSISAAPSQCLSDTDDINDQTSFPSHWRQAAYLLPEPMYKAIGDTIEIEVFVDINCGVFVQCHTI